MRTIKWNGEQWYECNHSIAKRIRRWLIWIGGWEKANGAGWRFRTDIGKRFVTPWPVSVLDHWVTVYGKWFQLRTSQGWFVVSKDRAFISHDGTPQGAHLWFWGEPRHVVSGSKRFAA